MTRTLHTNPLGKGYGWRQPRYPSHQFPLYMAHLELAALPNSVDLRPHCPPVYDQGNLGSCTANAAAGLAEFLMLMEQLADFVPSRLFIYYNERTLEHDVPDDAGASLADMAKVIGTQGCPPETDWPYDISKFADPPPTVAIQDGLKYLVTGISQVQQDLNSMKSVLSNGYPIAVGFSVFESFESKHVADTGIVPMPRKYEQLLGGHAVLVVGYDDAHKWFIVRNSWGTGWGMSVTSYDPHGSNGGYFVMPYAYLTNPRLASDFWTASGITHD